MTTAAGAGAGTKGRILIIDDDALVRRFVGALLSNGGYEVHEAADGEIGLRVASMMTPDLILVDLVMPYRDGYELITALRQEETTRAIPVIILSVRDREEDVVKGLRLGADDYIVKPFSTQELLVRIEKLLRRAR